MNRRRPPGHIIFDCGHRHVPAGAFSQSTSAALCAGLVAAVAVVDAEGRAARAGAVCEAARISYTSRTQQKKGWTPGKGKGPRFSAQPFDFIGRSGDSNPRYAYTYA